MCLHEFRQLICIVLLFGCDILVSSEGVDKTRALTRAGNQDWGYVDVRPEAHMFWWLFETHHSTGAEHRPLIMWLQGGPGYGSSGRGNFQLIGPLDLNFEPRNTSWIKEASLLFVDNPVGSGFSYVDEDSAYTTDTDQIANDLLALMRSFLNDHPKFKAVPFYIFGQSYGGKMAAVFAQKLYLDVENANIECNFQGFAMGNSWISPVDSTLSWASLLLDMSLVDKKGHDAIQREAELVRTAAKSGAWEMATLKWANTQQAVFSQFPGVDFYNILNIMSGVGTSQKRELRPQENPNWVLPGEDLDLTVVMDGPVRNYLETIPSHVSFFRETNRVFEHHSADFMKPVYGIVSDLLERTDLQVVVYQGQLDLICCTTGALKWTQRMEWSGLENYNNATRRTLRNPETNEVEMFVKEYGNFQFYWVLGGGHSIAEDRPDTTLRLLRSILPNYE